MTPPMMGPLFVVEGLAVLLGLGGVLVVTLVDGLVVGFLGVGVGVSVGESVSVSVFSLLGSSGGFSLVGGVVVGW
jgi:hypothetical protein